MLNKVLGSYYIIPTNIFLVHIISYISASLLGYMNLINELLYN